MDSKAEHRNDVQNDQSRHDEVVDLTQVNFRHSGKAVDEDKAWPLARNWYSLILERTASELIPGSKVRKHLEDAVKVVQSSDRAWLLDRDNEFYAGWLKDAEVQLEREHRLAEKQEQVFERPEYQQHMNGSITRVAEKRLARVRRKIERRKLLIMDILELRDA